MNDYADKLTGAKPDYEEILSQSGENSNLASGAILAVSIVLFAVWLFAYLIIHYVVARYVAGGLLFFVVAYGVLWLYVIYIEDPRMNKKYEDYKKSLRDIEESASHAAQER